MKMRHKLFGIPFAACMAGIIAFVVSAALTPINTRLGVGHLARVLHGYALAFPVALTGVAMLQPVAGFLVKKTVRTPPWA